MKILIAYSSANGTTAKCADMLAEKLKAKNEVSLVNVKDVIPAPEGFDAVILGSSVRMSKISKKIKEYICQNIEALNKTLCGVFICCGLPEEFESYAKEQLPKGFEPSLRTAYFGGELKPKCAKGFDKFILKAMRRAITQHDFEDGNFEGVLPEILPESISNFADIVNMKLYEKNNE